MFPFGIPTMMGVANGRRLYGWLDGCAKSGYYQRVPKTNAQPTSWLVLASRWLGRKADIEKKREWHDE